MKQLKQTTEVQNIVENIKIVIIINLNINNYYEINK